MHRFLARNSPDDLLFAALLALGVLALSILTRRYVLARLEALAAKNATVVDDLIVHFVKSIRGWGWSAIAVASGLSALDFTAAQDRIVHDGLVVAFAAQGGICLQSVITFAVQKRREREERPGAATTLAAVNAIGNLLVWSAVLLAGLSNLGVEISALAATLGVGGLAAAFAVQNLLGDLFASLSIYLDRPFDIGDAIQIDQLVGTVESISWRSTRVRSVSGEQIVFGNGDLTRTRIQNFRRLDERRVLIRFRLPLDAPMAVLESMPARAKALVEKEAGTRFERAHLTDVGEHAFVFELVFWSTTPDFQAMLDRKQSVILGLRRELDTQSISFAVPRMTLDGGA